jgi:hypothetical protein
VALWGQSERLIGCRPKDQAVVRGKLVIVDGDAVWTSAEAEGTLNQRSAWFTTLYSRLPLRGSTAAMAKRYESCAASDDDAQK